MLLFMKITVFDITVLIDTWWNVNEFIDTIKRTCNLVLIDTWWNVNKTLDDIYILLHLGFNRYMVECEFGSYANLRTIRHVF